MNSVNIIGRLTRDPELKTTSGGKTVTEFTIAVDKFGSEEGMFFRVKAWGKTAEFVSNYVQKGHKVAVSGRLDQRKYTDQNGNNREIVEIVADNVQSLTPKGEGTSRPATTPVEAVPEYDPFADE